MGVASEWNIWVWLECIGVVSGCCCKEVYTVEPPNKGQLATRHFVPCSEVGLS